ncbi:MAG: SMP-30/gluconolactonase/LRE family protein [Gammaproteobacteria bacterium]|nr:SMP-30/gluconolactonase/LRE family protein [Gammaproteobacteria bacterium]
MTKKTAKDEPRSGSAHPPSAAAEPAPGDVFVAATKTFQPIDFRKGIRGDCRILHCDRNLKVKSSLYNGEVGLVVGLAIDADEGVLYSTNPQQNSFTCFNMAGDIINGPDFLPQRRYGNMVIDNAGRVIVGVHSLHGSENIRDNHGDGKLVRFCMKQRTFEFFEVEYDGGRGGKHCVSNLALAPDGTTVYYVSEAGRRVLRYDMNQQQQLPDFLCLDPDEPLGTYGLGVTSDGNILMAAGVGALLFDARGELLYRYDVPAVKGWTRARLAADGKHFFLGNFLDGILQRRRIIDGEITGEMNVGYQGSLTSVVEYFPAGTLIPEA